MKQNWGMLSLGLEAVLDLGRLEDWDNRNVSKLKSKYNFLLLGWTNLQEWDRLGL